MALIIELNRDVEYEPELKDAASSRQQQSAEVILFPGVRYEHWRDEQVNGEAIEQQSPTTAATEAERDWLKV